MIEKASYLYYDVYEEFYAMADKSKAFRMFCKDAFGKDFSQDGFSDIKQIERILQYIPDGKNVHILDIGCGNGKLLGYLQEKTGAYIHGFDYSGNAIKTAQALYPTNSEFKEGIIDKINYPNEKFDVILSMDTIYFAKNMSSFVARIRKWLKQTGTFFVGYQEGDVMAKTENIHTTVLTSALKENNMKYEAMEITGEVYELLKRKRECALMHQKDFEAEGEKRWFDLLMLQTECATEPYEEFRNKMARYIYVIKK